MRGGEATFSTTLRTSVIMIPSSAAMISCIGFPRSALSAEASSSMLSLTR